MGGWKLCVSYGYVLCLTNNCHVLLFPAGSALSIDGGNFGRGVGNIHLTGLACTGNETSLANCTIVRTFFSFFCSHDFDVGILCPSESLSALNSSSAFGLRNFCSH